MYLHKIKNLFLFKILKDIFKTKKKKGNIEIRH